MCRPAVRILLSDDKVRCQVHRLHQALVLFSLLVRAVVGDVAAGGFHATDPITAVHIDVEHSRVVKC